MGEVVAIKTRRHKQWCRFLSHLAPGIAIIFVLLFAVGISLIQERSVRAENLTVFFDTAADHSHGQKSVLFIRARFPDDLGGALPSDAVLSSNSSVADNDFRNYSFGQFAITWNVGPV